MSFDYKQHMIRVQGGREYLPVAGRLVWFRQERPGWGVASEPVVIKMEPENGRPPYAIFSASIFNDEGKLMAQAYKYEDARGFPDFIEKANTGAIGRALLLCGYGTAFCGDELAEGDRLSDAPKNSPTQRPQNGRSGVDNAPRTWHNQPTAATATATAASAERAPRNGPANPVTEQPRREVTTEFGEDEFSDPFGPDPEVEEIARQFGGTVEEGPGGNTMVCSVCGAGVSEKVFSFSNSRFGRTLCMEHQKGAR